MLLVPQRHPHRRGAIELVRRLALADLHTFERCLTVASDRLEGAVVNERVFEHHLAAEAAHQEAGERLHAALTAEELQEAIGCLAAGRQHLAHVEAYVVGDAEPAERPPCLFDPAHGPSVTDAAWTTVRFGTRRVPACLRDAVLLAAGVPPDRRTVEVDGRTVAYWEAGDVLAVYLDGYFPDHPMLAWMRHPGNPLPRGVRRPPGIYGEANTSSPAGF